MPASGHGDDMFFVLPFRKKLRNLNNMVVKVTQRVSERRQDLTLKSWGREYEVEGRRQIEKRGGGGKMIGDRRDKKQQGNEVGQCLPERPRPNIKPASTPFAMHTPPLPLHHLPSCPSVS
jgi:hypothetical protein